MNICKLSLRNKYNKSKYRQYHLKKLIILCLVYHGVKESDHPFSKKPIMRLQNKSDKADKVWEWLPQKESLNYNFFQNPK